MNTIFGLEIHILSKKLVHERLSSDKRSSFGSFAFDEMISEPEPEFAHFDPKSVDLKFHTILRLPETSPNQA